MAANRKVQALVVVSAGRMNRDILTDWSLEEELLLQYYEMPLDAFFHLRSPLSALLWKATPR